MSGLRKVAIITGSSQGIGRACAEALGKEGYIVGVNARSEQRLRDTSAELEAMGIRCLVCPGDIADPFVAEQLLEKVVAKFQRIDVLVNNAGTRVLVPPECVTDNQWREVLGLNLDVAFRLCRLVFPYMREQGGGSIVNISSYWASKGTDDLVPYAASKAGLEALTRCLAVAWARYGIRVNAVAPGYTLTPHIRERLEGGFLKEEAIVRRVPLGRMGNPGEVAEAVVFLAGDRASYITGAVVPVDGGLAVQGR